MFFLHFVQTHHNYFLERGFESVSSNINEVIRAILNFFIQNFHTYKKAQNAYKRTKIKNAPKKHLRGKQSLIRLFSFLCFCLSVFVPFSAFSAFCAFCVCEIFSSKKNKKFTTALITSFILLLNFQLSQSFSMITICFNHNPFQLSQSFSIITIFFNLFTTCDTIFRKQANVRISLPNMYVLTTKHDKDILSISQVPNFCFLL